MCGGGGGGKIKGDANQASHKLERGCGKIYFPDCDHKGERGGETPSLPSRPYVVTLYQTKIQIVANLQSQNH